MCPISAEMVDPKTQESEALVFQVDPRTGARVAMINTQQILLGHKPRELSLKIIEFKPSSGSQGDLPSDPNVIGCLKGEVNTGHVMINHFNTLLLDGADMTFPGIVIPIDPLEGGPQ